MSVKVSYSKIESKWRLKQANWPLFERLSFGDCDGRLNPLEKMKYITNTILKAAETSIPKTGTKNKKPGVPWWNNEIKNIIKLRNKAVRKFNSHPISENLINYRKIRAKAKFIIKEKRKSWENYISTITHSTASKFVWDKINKIQSRYSQNMKFLHIDGNIIYNPFEIANIFADKFYRASSNINYDVEFLNIKYLKEQTTFSFNSRND